MQGLPESQARASIASPSWSGSQGAMAFAALGANMLSDADSNFTAGHSWTLGANWSVVAEKLRHVGGSTELATLGNNVAKALYLATYTTSNVTAGSVAADIGYGLGLPVTTNKTLAQGVVGYLRPVVGFTPSSDFAGDIDTVLLQKYSATAATSGGITVIDWIYWSADVSPVAGLVAIIDETGAVLWDQDIALAGPGGIRFDGGFYSPDGAGLGVVLVPDGTMIGKLNVKGR